MWKLSSAANIFNSVIFFCQLYKFRAPGLVFLWFLGLRQYTTIYHVTKGYAISAIVTELKMKLTFY